MQTLKVSFICHRQKLTACKIYVALTVLRVCSRCCLEACVDAGKQRRPWLPPLGASVEGKMSNLRILRSGMAATCGQRHWRLSAGHALQAFMQEMCTRQQIAVQHLTGKHPDHVPQILSLFKLGFHCATMIALAEDSICAKPVSLSGAVPWWLRLDSQMTTGLG